MQLIQVSHLHFGLFGRVSANIWRGILDPPEEQLATLAIIKVWISMAHVQRIYEAAKMQD